MKRVLLALGLIVVLAVLGFWHALSAYRHEALALESGPLRIRIERGTSLVGIANTVAAARVGFPA